MKRWMWVPLAMVAAVGLGASSCQPIPPGWKPPQVETLEVSPTPVVAGSTFGVTLKVVDDGRVLEILLTFLTPSMSPGGDYSAPVTCDPVDHPTVQQSNTFFRFPEKTAEVELDLVCSLPDHAPSGTWRLLARTDDGVLAHTHGDGYGGRSTTFEVTGGSDDLAPPVLESAVVSPDPVIAGEPFDVTFVVSDDHLGDYGLTRNMTTWSRLVPMNATSSCPTVSTTRVSPTTQEFVFSCPPHEASEEVRVGYAIADAIGQGRYVWIAFPIVSAT